MSTYGDQMERENSTQSLSSRGGSEMESRYEVDSGFYMSSFAAAIFLGSLVTFGVLLFTLLVALTVMLQSCQSKSAGVVEIGKLSDDYNYCKIFFLHAELNSFEVDSFPSICKGMAMWYIKEGQYARDLNFTMLVVEGYFSSVQALDDGLDVVLVDIDDIFPPNIHYTDLLLYRYNQYGCGDCVEEATHLKHMFILRLYRKLLASGWSLILLSRKPEGQRNATIEHLLSAGYGGWSSLIMRQENEMQKNTREFFSQRREVMQKEGFRIKGIISSQINALTGPYLGKRVFKLPNPFYYSFENYIKTTNLY